MTTLWKAELTDELIAHTNAEQIRLANQKLQTEEVSSTEELDLEL
jgi:hypothetical protein